MASQQADGLQATSRHEPDGAPDARSRPLGRLSFAGDRDRAV